MPGFRKSGHIYTFVYAWKLLMEVFLKFSKIPLHLKQLISKSMFNKSVLLCSQSFSKNAIFEMNNE